jgi:hypothetical protein
MDHQSSISPEEDLAPWYERQTLRMLASVLPRSVRRRQIHEWQDQLDCTRATNGDLRRELMQVVRSAPSIAWTAIPSFLRVSLPSLATAMMAALVLWPAGHTPPVGAGYTIVNTILTRYEQALQDKDYQTLCDELLASKVVDGIRSAGLPARSASASVCGPARAQSSQC